MKKKMVAIILVIVLMLGVGIVPKENFRADVITQGDCDNCGCSCFAVKFYKAELWIASGRTTAFIAEYEWG